MAQKAIAKADTTQTAQWSAEEVDTIRRTVAEGASDEELKMFLHLSQAYGLDPFAKDIWFIKAGGKPIIMTSRDGYLTIANRNPHFEGMEADVVYAGDTFEKTKDGVRHVYGTQNRGGPIGAYAVVSRDDRKMPTYVFAPFKDYNKGSGTWRQYPHAMILKVAEAMALKRAFSISGMVTQEELDEDELKARKERWETQRQAQEAQHVVNGQKTQLYKRYMAVCGEQPQHAQNAMMKVTNGKKPADWTADDIASLEADVAKREEELSHSTTTFDEPIEAETVDMAEPDHIVEPDEMIKTVGATEQNHIVEPDEMVGGKK